MNSKNYQDDLSKNKNTSKDAEAVRMDELKKKLYSSSTHDSAVRERGFKQHRIDIGKDWDETDEKQTQLNELREKEARDAKMGLATENSLHHGSALYGHYSPSEDATHKQQVNTSFGDRVEKVEKKEEESVGSFLSNKFSDKRAADTQKKLAITDMSMRYASAQAESDLYPSIKDLKIKEEIGTKSETATEVYHQDLNVFTVGNTRNTGKPNKVSDDKDKIVPKEEKARFTFGIFLFVSMLIFFLSSLGYAYYSLNKGTNTVSPDKVDIVVAGPISVRSGEVNDFTVDITNNNSIDLTLSDLVIQYPFGTMSALDNTQSLNNQRINLGVIKPKETVRRKISAIFFGEENIKKNINYAVEFSIPDSTSIFSTTKNIAVIIAGSPITAKITNIKEVTNNQELSFDIEIQSNTQEVVKNIQLQVEYPFGYKLTQSNIKPTFDNNIWNLGDIPALDTKTITLKGKLIGTSNLEKNFRFILGVSDIKTGQMSTVLSTQDQKVVIQKPFVSTKLSLDGLVQEFTPVSYDSALQGDIVFVNNLDTSITDVVVEMTIGGVLINRSSIKANKGFYRSSDDIVFWDKAQEDKLSSIDPGDSRELSFNFNIIKSKESLVKALRRSTATLTISVKAKRLNENNVPEEVKSVINQEIRLETNPIFSGGIAYTNGPFKNTGSFPPNVNEETTYTYMATISNTSNALKQTVFVAKLPPNATWKNVYSKDIPMSAVSYSQSKREIVINLGDIPAGTGIDTKAKEFAFQIGFTPTLTELGQSPVLLLNPRISGTDVFTGRRLERGVDALTIIPTLDVGNVGEGRVQ